MDPFYRFFPFKNRLLMISWNAVLGCDAFQRMAEIPEESERVNDVRGYHARRTTADGISHSVLDAMPDRTPYYCYMGFSLGEFGIMPLGGRFGLRWYPIHDVLASWEESPAQSRLALKETLSRIERKFGVTLKGPPQGYLP
jgi:LysM repeat protein